MEDRIRRKILLKTGYAHKAVSSKVPFVVQGWVTTSQKLIKKGLEIEFIIEIKKIGRSDQ